MYLTPLGRMSGPLVLINAIHSLQQHGPLKVPSLWMKLLITVSLIIVISVIFARFPSFRATLLWVLVISVTLLPISYSLFNGGIWLDFVLPLFGVWGCWMWVRNRGRPQPVNDSRVN